MTRDDYLQAISLLIEAADAQHNDLSGDERKILGDRLRGLANDLYELIVGPL